MARRESRAAKERRMFGANADLANPEAPRRRNPTRPSGFEVRFESPCGMCGDLLRIGQRAVMRHGKAIHVGCAPGADDE